MNRKPIVKNFKENTYSGFEFLPVETSNNSIQIYHPFAELAYNHFSNRGLNITCLESGSTKISFNGIDLDIKKEILEDLKVFLKKSRKEVIDNFLIYKFKGRNYL
ncbi:hypothetical protein [Poseidonibacter ostreae]|uniref:Uncharacterized protein n=1 Tax=Poseidonibacter ostreae TaxID=2654171 RepID=A0A6L4WTZ1_9BACT|nr:hypothetical protein [Poseidonibacter ostreae]KAB7888867.1 hypothetical protein GBG18_12185 [Poseidonibacter ostreae]KAB7889642.1 hypothetical protein GBG19_05385 [Poseidonibacter ostreae]